MIDFGIIKKVDSEIYDLILKEYERQNNELVNMDFTALKNAINKAKEILK